MISEKWLLSTIQTYPLTPVRISELPYSKWFRIIQTEIFRQSNLDAI